MKLVVLGSILLSTQLSWAESAKPSQCAAAILGQVSQNQTVSNWEQRRASMVTLTPRIERRPLILTTGDRKDSIGMDAADYRIDTADPSLLMPIHYPDGTTKLRINFSGLRYIEFDRAEDVFKGGIKKVRRSRGFYADGTEMVGAYHNEAWPWDVVIYKNDEGEQIALGGVMRQFEQGRLPNVAHHNFSRSRWWGKVKHIQLADGSFEEHILWQGPVHDFNVTPHRAWEFHGYGGTLVTQFNSVTGIHEPLKLKNGNYLLAYERVVEERDNRPWVTTTMMREMDPSLKFTVGPEIETTQIKSSKTGAYYQALRRGTPEHFEGILREGDNVLFDRKNKQFIKVGSANDYVRTYGIYLDYAAPGAPAQSKYKNAVNDEGELIDFARTLKLREMYNATWVGRPQLIYDPKGQLWLLFHFVDKNTIPPGGPVEGWPSAEDFPKYARTTGMLPVQLVKDKRGQPSLQLDIEDKYKELFNVR